VTCAECRALISRADNVRRLAWDIEAAFPACACEAHSIGDGSPGAVQNPEILYRLIASPTDIDPLTNEVTSTAFEKAYENGLSVFRECATNEHIVALITDRLTIKRGRRPFPTILGLFRIECAAIREVRGRDGRYRPPPAQNRASGIPARGSHLGWVTANRCCGHGCRIFGCGR